MAEARPPDPGRAWAAATSRAARSADAAARYEAEVGRRICAAAGRARSALGLAELARHLGLPGPVASRGMPWRSPRMAPTRYWSDPAAAPCHEAWEAERGDRDAAVLVLVFPFPQLGLPFAALHNVATPPVGPALVYAAGGDRLTLEALEASLAAWLGPGP